MTEAENAACFDVIHGRKPPDPAFTQAGKDAHAAGKQFHEGPKPDWTLEALCWRIGWNDAALATRDDPPCR